MRNRSAFTLIELTVVLALIGLIAGGVMAVSGFSKSAERASAINQAKYYLNAFNQFQSRYGSIPGDMSTATAIWGAATCARANGSAVTAGVCDGNGNGLIRAPVSANNTNETFYAFEHMSRAGFITGVYTGSPGSAGAVAGVLGVNVPGSAIPEVGFFFSYPLEVDAFGAASGTVTANYVTGHNDYYDGFYGHFLRMGRQVVGANSSPITAFLKPTDAYELDSKFDDGRPAGGWIRSLKPNGMANCADSATDATAAYQVTTKTATCGLLLLQQ